MRWRALYLALFFFCFFEVDAEQAKDLHNIENELRSLEQDLARFKEILETSENKKSVLEEKLKQNEKGISNLVLKINRIEQTLTRNSNKISQLTKKQHEFKLQKTEQQKYVEEQILAAYETGTWELTKLVLSQEDPNKVTRLLTYYEYFIAARAKQIENYNNTLKELDRVNTKLEKERLSLAINRKALDQERLALAETQRQKREALAGLSALVQNTGNEITKREKNRDRLEKLLNYIRTKLGDPPEGGSAAPFKGMRGKMLLPVEGKITKTFGKVRNAGRLKWNGLFIEANEGHPVYAVHYGRVIFSDWLRGFGLLMIISHGDGFMSLYGHNQALYLETGDLVEAGTLIATVGNSGGQSQTGLYFEIRINGEPSDPERWCIARDHGPA